MVSLEDLKDLQRRYGYNAKLSEVINNYGYICPQCNGTGHVIKHGDWGYTDDRYVCCDLCKGKGATSVEYKPKMVQQGWTTD